jgi:hypothetical protein
VDLVVYDDDDHRYVPWRVVLAALLLVAALVGAATFVLGRSAAGAEEVGGLSALEPVTAPSTPASSAPASSSPSPEGSSAPTCASALTRADAALERSQRLEQALAEHTRLMDELLAQRLDTQQALDQTLPVLTEGATQRRLFAEDVAAYERARQECPSG